MTDDEVVHCDQCHWPVRRGELWSVVYGPCEDCGAFHAVGIVHQAICMLDRVLGEKPVATQKRRAGLLRMN